MATVAGPLIHLGTRCSSVDEFVERFAPFATETSLVMPTTSEVAPGTEGRFVIHLKDRTPVMSGRCRVEEVRPVASSGGPGSGRMVMRVRLLGMDAPSRGVHKQLLAKRPVPAPPTAAATKPPPPLRIVRAPTLMGAAGQAPIGTASTLIGTAAPPIGTAPTLIGTLAPPLPASPPPPITGDELDRTMPSIKVPELQVPSAAFTLPANPLSDLEAGDLASFIECTLFESEIDPNAAPESERDDDAKAPSALAEEAAAKSVGMAAALPSAEPRSTAVVPRMEVREAAELEPASVRAQLRRKLVQAAPYALCTVIGVIVGTILHRSPAPPPPARPARETEVVAAHAPVAPAPVAALAPPAAEPAPPAVAAAPAVEPEPAPAAPPTRAAAPALAGACSLNVTSEPPEAQVLWGAKPLGQTPLKGAKVPCGAATITLRHERYKEVRRAVRADAARPLVVSERLHRPNGTLLLSSSPPRAIFTVNDLSVGPAPRKVSAWRFETIHVEATLPGYLPWKRTLYFKDEVAKLNAQLVSAKPDTHGAMHMRR